MKIIKFDAISSTNDYAKAHVGQEDFIVIARRQTGGRGTKNRTFSSGMGGLYLSKLTHYTAFSASDVFKIMINAAMAVCKTMEDFSLTPYIKWPNDVFVDGKKICGILIENTFSGANVATSVVGIGINVNNQLPEELREIAVTMSQALGKRLAVSKVQKSLVLRLNQSFDVEEYKKYVLFFNQKIVLTQADGRHVVVAKDIDERGRLIVEENGLLRTVTAGEVSVRVEL